MWNQRSADNKLDYAAIRAETERLRTEAKFECHKARIIRTKARIMRFKNQITLAQICYINENPYIIRARSEFDLDTNSSEQFRS